MRKKKILFICVHNSFRSQIAEAWLTEISGEGFEAQSGGLEPGVVYPLAIETMGGVGIEISRKRWCDGHVILAISRPVDVRERHFE